MSIDSMTDRLNVTVNGATVAHHADELIGTYKFMSSPSDTPITGQTYNVVVTDKNPEETK